MKSTLLRTCAGLLACGLLPLLARADESLVGQKVYVKDGARGKVGTTEVDLRFIPFPVTVLNEQGDWLWVGQAWLKKADVQTTQDALAFFSDKIEKEPAVAEWRLHRGAVKRAGRDFDGALQDQSEAIRLDPKDPVAWNNRADTRIQQGDYENALKDLTEALRLDRNSALAYTTSAELRASCPDERYRDADKAIKNAKIACQLIGWNAPECLDILAAAYASKGDFDNALKWQKKAIELAGPAAGDLGYRHRLELYQAGQPYRQEPQP